MIRINDIDYLTPSEITNKLNITRAAVKYLRQKNKVKYLPYKNKYVYHPSILSTYKKTKTEENLTFEGINERLKPRQIEMASNFEGIHKKAIFRCLIDGYEWEANASAVLYNKGKCKRCSYKYTKNSINELLKNRKLEIIEDYEGPNIKKKWMCKKCNKIWLAEPHRVLHGGTGCPNCLLLDENKINQRLKENNTKIQLIGEYMGYHLKHDFICLNCGNIWKTTVNLVLMNRGCPLCASYKNERYTKKCLEEIFPDIAISHHYYMNIGNKRFFVDFRFLINKKEYYIEYNGVQHYKLTTFGKMPLETAKIKFKQQKVWDKNLRKYCQKKDITLIEIDGRKYKHKKIKNYLLNIFNQ